MDKSEEFDISVKLPDVSQRGGRRRDKHYNLQTFEDRPLKSIKFPNSYLKFLKEKNMKLKEMSYTPSN